MAETIQCEVAFTGGRFAAGPATCAQRHMWNLIQQRMPDSAFYNQIHRAALPPGSTLSDVREVLGELVGRHESLRTVYQVGGDGGLRQRVIRSGSFTVGTVEAADEADVWRVIDAWGEDTRRVAFDHAVDLPFRAAIVCEDGEPVQVALCVSHMAADLMGLRVFEAEIARLSAARAEGRAADPPPEFRQPLEQAAFEGSERGLRLLARAGRYWDEQLAGMPATMFPGAGTVPESALPPFHSTVLESRAVALALPVLAERYRAGSSAVLLAVVSVLLGRRGGLRRCGLRLLAANRTEGVLRGTVANLHQEVPVTVDLTGETVADVVRSARVAAMRAYANGLYDPDQAERVVQGHERARGEHIDLSCCFNDARAVREDRPGASPATPAEIRAAMAWSTIEDDDLHEAERFFLVVHDDVPDRVRLVLGAQPHVLSPDDVRAFLVAVERLLVSLVADEMSLADCAAVAGASVEDDTWRSPRLHA
ncbi:condensation domain-containing protein [Streptomyces uncialis]|uniref:condensation domain-containing protein n=1 Tax=Streptomyces uncialis TaxID=1048205 RepID=UPI003809A8C6